MADMTLCSSDTCPVQTTCRRNPGHCSRAYRADGRSQSWAEWWPELGDECDGYLPASDDGGEHGLR